MTFSVYIFGLPWVEGASGRIEHLQQLPKHMPKKINNFFVRLRKLTDASGFKIPAGILQAVAVATAERVRTRKEAEK
jgi:inorganic pyrophosphatase